MTVRKGSAALPRAAAYTSESAVLSKCQPAGQSTSQPSFGTSSSSRGREREGEKALSRGDLQTNRKIEEPPRKEMSRDSVNLIGVQPYPRHPKCYCPALSAKVGQHFTITPQFFMTLMTGNSLPRHSASLLCPLHSSNLHRDIPSLFYPLVKPL